MKPHQPILNGKPPEVAIMTMAIINQTIEKPHRMRPTRNPTTYNMSPARATFERL